LLLLQHRGQDAAGIATAHGKAFNMYKGNGLVRDVFRTRNMRSLPGTAGIGQVRYPTAGSAANSEEAQPFYVNAPFGIILAHNGNLTNAEQLKDEMFRIDRRHVNTDSDSEVLLNVFAHELHDSSSGLSLDATTVFKAIEGVHRRVRGSYAVVAMIAGYGLVAFRDPYGIRPLVLGENQTSAGTEYMLASESVTLEGMGFTVKRDIQPGEAVYITFDGQFFSQPCAQAVGLNPCIFEYVYLARPDSVMDGVSVYAARLKMGEYLAEQVRQRFAPGEIDVVMPIPDSARPAAMQLAKLLNLDYREGFIKNRYIGRTFIMPGQNTRRKSVRQKLNAVAMEFKDKTVMIVDDSIVRGTTSREIVMMARESGAKKVIFASAAPPVRFANVYGIDMPTRGELIAHGHTDEEICKLIGADALVYQTVEDMKRAVQDLAPQIKNFEASCFDGHYITGDITPEYLEKVEYARLNPTEKEGGGSQLNLGFMGNDS
jgi:amidophosphoribosyltransferase